MKYDVVIFEKNAITTEIITGYLKEFNNIFKVNSFDNYDEGIRCLKKNPVKIVLFSFLDDEDFSSKYLKKLSKLNLNIIVLSEKYTTTNIIKILRLGAKDFVSKPVIKKELFDAINKCMQENESVCSKSHIISVFSNKGGVGKTAISTNLAVELSKITREKVLLLDLNLPLGDIATFLDINPTVSISDLVDKDADIICNACQQYKDTSVYILAEPLYVDKNVFIKSDKILGFLDCLKSKFAYIVIDMGISVDQFNLNVLKNSDKILLVTVVNLPLIRNCQRCLDLFANMGFPKNKIQIIINRYLDNDEITQEDVEVALNRRVYWKVPNNYFTVMSSINKGIPVSEVNANSNISDSFSKLASKLIDDLLVSELKKENSQH